MTATLLFVAFALLMLAGVPIGAALGLAGTAAIAVANADSQWFGLLAVPQNFYAGLGKYPLLAIPMFVLVGSIFDRSGVALRLVNFAVAMVGRGPGMLPLVAIAVAMFLGGISGSGPANAAAVGGVMIAAMSRAGYPPSFSASVVGAAAATDILIPPSVAFIIYSVLVPGASVPALFAAGMVPGVLASIALIVPAVWMARKHKMGALEAEMPRPPFWKSLREATWGLAAPVLIIVLRVIQGLALGGCPRARRLGRCGQAHFVGAAGSFAEALESALRFAGADNYCPVLVGAIVVAAVLMVGGRRLGRYTAALATAGLLFGLGASAAYTVETVLNGHGGPMPTSGPARSGDHGFGGPGGMSQPTAAVEKLVTATDNLWAAATVGSHLAGSLELSTGTSIMAIGGFNGGDNSPTLEQFQQYVHDGQIRYFLAGDGRGPGGPGGHDTTSSGSQITEWVQDHFVAQNIDGTTIYDLEG